MKVPKHAVNIGPESAHEIAAAYDHAGTRRRKLFVVRIQKNWKGCRASRPQDSVSTAQDPLKHRCLAKEGGLDRRNRHIQKPSPRHRRRSNEEEILGHE
jgi:hypothetical protein